MLTHDGLRQKELKKWIEDMKKTNIAAFAELAVLIYNSFSSSKVHPDRMLKPTGALLFFLRSICSLVAPVVSLLPRQTIPLLAHLQTGQYLSVTQEKLLSTESPVFYQFYRYLLSQSILLSVCRCLIACYLH